MKILSAFLIFCALLFTNCKEAATPPEEVTNIIKTAPFENNQFKIERATINLPDGVVKIHFFDESNGICLASGFNDRGLASSGCSLYTTHDRGATWTLSYELGKMGNYIRGYGFEVIDNQSIVAFVGGTIAEAATTEFRQNLIIRSTNKGKSWTTTTIKNTQLRGLTLGTDKVLYAVGDGTIDGMYSNNIPTFMSSDDAGLTWKRAPTPSFQHPSSIFFTPNKIFFQGNNCDTRNLRLETNDKGATWKNTENTENVQSVSFIDKTGYYYSYVVDQMSFSIFKTIDGGDKWSNIRTFKNYLNEIKMLSPTTTLALGSSKGNLSAGFYYSSDAGKTWTDIEILDNLEASQLITSSFYTSKNGYIAASKNVLYRITFK
jgi:BNR/Asp-box repeat